jgi:hypothetical protein
MMNEKNTAHSLLPHRPALINGVIEYTVVEMMEQGVILSGAALASVSIVLSTHPHDFVWW